MLRVQGGDNALEPPFLAYYYGEREKYPGYSSKSSKQFQKMLSQHSNTQKVSHATTVEFVRQALSSVASRLDGWFDASGTVLTEKPLDKSWSVAENLEHVALTNHFLLKIIRRHVGKALSRASEGATAESESNRFEDISAVRDRVSFYWKNPEHMMPSGKTPLGEVRTELRLQFSECQQLLDSMKEGEGHLNRVNLTVNNLGKLNMYEWLYFLSQHAMRHEDKISQAHPDRFVLSNENF